MSEKNEKEYVLISDEPTTWLDESGKVLYGRKLTFILKDQTVIDINVTRNEYYNVEKIKEKLLREIEAHSRLKEL